MNLPFSGLCHNQSKNKWDSSYVWYVLDPEEETKVWHGAKFKNCRICLSIQPSRWCIIPDNSREQHGWYRLISALCTGYRHIIIADASTTIHKQAVSATDGESVESRWLISLQNFMNLSIHLRWILRRRFATLTTHAMYIEILGVAWRARTYEFPRSVA